MSENERRILKRDPNPHIFRPLTLRGVTLPNRIMLSPMCQYSATDGLANDWHRVHLGARAVGGVGLVFTESVHTEARGRITHHCLGLWNDRQADAFRPITAFVSAQGAVPGIQIGHAGRKASVTRPWERSKPLPPDDGGWPSIGPSPLAFAKGWQTPQAMRAADIGEAIDATAGAASRARDVGFRVLEIHGAHGYLIHQFLSPLSNRRTDAYGGTFIKRCRFLMETIAAVRSVWPADLPLFLRLSCTDWVDGGWDLDQTIKLAKLLKAAGDVDLLDCSSGGNDPRQVIPIHPGYQVGFAEAVRRESGMATSAIGLIHSPDLAESIVANGRADLVAMGRALMADPHWPLRAATTLKATNVRWPVPYERSNIF